MEKESKTGGRNGDQGILIKNVRLEDGLNECRACAEVFIKDGVIMSIREEHEEGSLSPCGSPDRGIRVINGAGLVMAPGLVDVHVHFRDPGFTSKEDIHTGAQAAAKGGFTSVVMMGNTRPCPDSVHTLKAVLERAAAEGINIYSVANLTKGMEGKETVDYEALIRAGAAGFSDDGRPVLDGELLKRAFKELAPLKVPASLHEEDPSYIKNNGINEGEASRTAGIGGSDRMAEISMVKRDIGLALETGVRLVIQHVSTREAVGLIREGKKRGGDIHAEATPHHFTLTEEAVKKYGTNAKMNPPLRTEEDRLAIIEGLKDGTIDMIATDHAPHTREEKALEFTKAPSGITGLETALSLGLSELVGKGHLSLRELIRLMSRNPAEVYGLDAGYIEVGRRADIVLFDPDAVWIPREGEQASRSVNSPFFGRTLRGRVLYTICGGRVVYEATS